MKSGNGLATFESSAHLPFDSDDPPDRDSIESSDPEDLACCSTFDRKTTGGDEPGSTERLAVNQLGSVPSKRKRVGWSQPVGPHQQLLTYWR